MKMRTVAMDGSISEWANKTYREPSFVTLPLADAAGGWKEPRTLLAVYQQPDIDTMLAVMSVTRKFSDRATGT